MCLFCRYVSVCLSVSGAQLADLSSITDISAQVRPLCTFCEDQGLRPATRGSKLTNKRRKLICVIPLVKSAFQESEEYICSKWDISGHIHIFKKGIFRTRSDKPMKNYVEFRKWKKFFTAPLYFLLKFSNALKFSEESRTP